jgi:hypothetical protein
MSGKSCQLLLYPTTYWQANHLIFSPSGLVSCDWRVFCGCGLCQLLLYPTTGFRRKNMPFWLLGVWFLRCEQRSVLKWSSDFETDLRTSLRFHCWKEWSNETTQKSSMMAPSCRFRKKQWKSRWYNKYWLTKCQLTNCQLTKCGLPKFLLKKGWLP